MFNLGSLPTLVLVYPLWGLATPLLFAGIGGGLLGTILASVGLLRGRAPWYAALKYLLILLASFAIWQTGADLVSPWNEAQGLELIIYIVFALPTTGLILFRARRWLTNLWRNTNGQPPGAALLGS